MTQSVNESNESKDLGNLSWAQKFKLPEYQEKKREFLNKIRLRHQGDEKLICQELDKLQYAWWFNARPKQQTPKGDWFIWLLRSGRGFGKSRTASEWIKEKEEQARNAGRKVEMALVGNIYQDIEDAQVKQILECYHPDDPFKPKLFKQKLVWPSGCVAYLIQAETPEKFRSKNLTCVWMDELAKYTYPEAVMDAVMFVLRIKKNGDPQMIITTTPTQRTNKLLNKIESGFYGNCHLTVGSSYENADNLSELALKNLTQAYGGTRYGGQEIYGNYIESLASALWQNNMLRYWPEFEALQAQKMQKTLPNNFQETYLKSFKAVVVAVDPATTAHAASNETGLIVCARNYENQGFVLEDRSGKYTPNGWAEMAMSLLDKWKGGAPHSCIVAESNQGGDMVASTLHNVNPKVRVELVRATKGKILRAEPVARLYEKSLIYHLRPFGELEYQMTNFVGQSMERSASEREETSGSPDHLDALVWAFTYLFSDQLVIPSHGRTPFRIFNF